jgi:hypothetical protein
MLKSVSSITNAIGALNFKGTWDANANSPALASSVGTKGDYYVVGTAGSTNLNGISNWGVGDLATFNGSVWQRVEGGADLNGVNLSVSGTSTLSGLTASTALALNASKEIVSVTNTGTGDNVLATAPTLVGDVTLSTGNLVVADTKGIDFSATPGTGTSELLDDYEEGTFIPTIVGTTAAGTGTYSEQNGYYTKVGNRVFVNITLVWSAHTGTGNMRVSGLPFTNENVTGNISSPSFYVADLALTALNVIQGFVNTGSTQILLYQVPTGGGGSSLVPIDTAATLRVSLQYQTAS